MKVAYISGSLIPSDRANSIQVMKVCQALTQIGHQVRLLTPGQAHHTWESLAEHYGLVTPFDIQWLPGRAGLRRFDFALGATQTARRLSADVVYTRLIQAAVAGLMRGFPVLYEVHEMPGAGLSGFLFKALLRLPGQKRLLPISQALARDLQVNYPRLKEAAELVIAPSGVDLERYRDLPTPDAARTQLGLPEAPTIGYSGHLYPGKGMEQIFQLAQRVPEAHFLCVGGLPEDVTHWRNRAGEARLKNLTLTGFLPNQKIPSCLAAMDITLLPLQPVVRGSSGGDLAAHTSPLKLFEYMAAGKPILSSDLPVIREVLNPELAILLPPDNLEYWVEALTSLLGDPARRQSLGEKARQAAAGYTWQIRAEKSLAGFGGRHHR